MAPAGRWRVATPHRPGSQLRPGVLRMAGVPEHAATDNRGQIHLRRETATVLLVGQEGDRQWQPAPRQHCPQALWPQRTLQAREGHRGESVEDRTELQTEAVVGGEQRITGNVRVHLTIAQGAVGTERAASASGRWQSRPESLFGCLATLSSPPT